MNIPNEAVEAAASVTYRRQHEECHFPMGDWENLEGEFREPWMADARAALAAAAPHLFGAGPYPRTRQHSHLDDATGRGTKEQGHEAHEDGPGMRPTQRDWTVPPLPE